MKSINLLVHAISGVDIDFDTYELYSKIECGDYKKRIKELEENDLKEFIKHICEKIPIESRYILFGDFYYGYTIKQISKEFDLLRFGSNFNINIEIKHKSTNEKITKQLLQNRHYLNHLSAHTYHFAYISNEKTLFILEGNQIENRDISFLIELLEKQLLIKVEDIDKLFNPASFLASPFNSTPKFLQGKYFLTQQQSDIKNDIKNKIVTMSEVPQFFSLVGKPGTGKTLLAYNIAQELSQAYKVCVIHCGVLNDGHSELINNGIEIISIKKVETALEKKYDIIIVDEAQRILVNQFEKIIDYTSAEQKYCIFSYDPQQILSNIEEENDIHEKITKLENLYEYELSAKIRTNKELSSFVQALFDLSKVKKYKDITYSNIDVSHFKSHGLAHDYIAFLTSENWVFINYTPSQYWTSNFERHNILQIGTAHKIVGQEFDNVIVFIDNSFYYQEQKLFSKGREKIPYNFPKMLYQAITRARNKLCIVVIDNEPVFKEILDIIKNKL